MTVDTRGRRATAALTTLAATVGAALAVTGQLTAYRPSRALDDSRLVGVAAMRCDGAERTAPSLQTVQDRGSRASAAPAAAPDPSTRAPLRVIRDAYPSLSAVAVDMRRDEVAATDENLLQILVYDRLATTPPSGALTEPKRTLAGPNTDIEFQCSLYVDQETGEIYAVNNDTKNLLVVFSRGAAGNVRPDRSLLTPHGTFGIAVDEARQEMFLTIQHDSAVVVYRKGASGEEHPLRLLQGDRTLLADPHGIAIDPVNGLLFVANFGATHSSGTGPYRALDDLASRLERAHWPLGPLPGTGRYLPPSITVYPRDASGDVRPLRIIQGPNTRLNWPTGVAYHPARNELFVANDMDHSILVFRGDAAGDVAPIRVLRGARTLMQNPTGVFLDTKNNELWVANFGNHSLSVYDIGAEGDTAPRRTIRSSPTGHRALMIGNPGAIDFDPQRQEILVPN
jgi:DNA-binding beta-propeller fold protein YncE